MKTKILALSLAACAAASLVKADGLVPSVSNVTMAQTAHSRTVTIAYTLADAAAYVTLDIQTNATDTADGAWVSLGGANVCNATGDVWTTGEPEEAWLTFTGEDVEFHHHLGKRALPERDGRKFLVPLSASPVYFTGAALE